MKTNRSYLIARDGLVDYVVTERIDGLWQAQVIVDGRTIHVTPEYSKSDLALFAASEWYRSRANGFRNIVDLTIEE